MDLAVSMQPARPSYASLLIESLVNELPLGTATGFVVVRNGFPYLITNRHVVRGRNQDTDQSLHGSGGIPDSIRITHHTGGPLGSTVRRVESLYDDAETPIWLEHPIHGGEVDVVALPLSGLADVVLEVYDPWAPTRVAIGPSERVSIVGFPFGLEGGPALAIWVQGFVATETMIDYRHLPRFLIDSRTRKGQSGSPVVFYSENASFTSHQGASHVAAGRVEELIGVYPGRISKESDLGFVWRTSVIREILDGITER